MSDIFQEVEDDYRVEQFLRFWREHAKRLIAVLIAAILAGALYGFWQSWHEHKIEEQTRLLTRGLNDAPQLEALLPQLTGHRKIAGEFAMARQKADVDPQSAIKLYDSIAAAGDAATAEKDLAEIQLIGLQIDSGDPAVLSGKLKKFMDKDNPWRFSAMEWQALLDVRQNNLVEAHKLFAALAADSAAPDDIHERAGQLAQHYSGE